jgi:hypothetical protein
MNKKIIIYSELLKLTFCANSKLNIKLGVIQQSQHTGISVLWYRTNQQAIQCITSLSLAKKQDMLVFFTH